MYSRLFGTVKEAEQKQYRFDHCQELKKILPLLNILREKEIELKNAANSNGSESIDFKKHIVVAEFLTHIDKKINVFNNTPPHSNRGDETKDILMFVRDLLVKVEETLKKDGEILNTPRNNQRLYANNVMIYGSSLIGVLGCAMAGSLTVIGMFTAVCGGRLMSNIIRYQTGLSDLTPKSMRIVLDLATMLMEVGKNLMEDLSRNEIHMAIGAL